MAKLKNSEIDSAVIRAGANLTIPQARKLNEVSDKTWFRQYAKRSKENLKKILAKVKKGIKHGDYTYAQKAEDDMRGFELPKPKKVKKQKEKKQKKAEKMLGKKQNLPKAPRKVREKIRKEKKHSAYTQFEVHEGINSKRSREYRAKKGITTRGKEHGF